MSDVAAPDQEWADAINSEYGTDLKIEEAEEEEELDDAAKQAAEEETAAKAAAEKDGEEDEELEDDKDKKDPLEDESEEDKATREAAEKEAADKAAALELNKEEKQEQYATKDDIKSALREMDKERVTTAAQFKEEQKQVLEALYPEGINRQLLDSSGDPITGIDDLTKLINPKTDELFTEEEAGSWLLASQQQLNKDIEQLENYASEIVETNQSLREGSERVESVYGDLLKAMPEVGEKVLAAYEKTLVKDPKSGIVIKAPVDVVEFYDLALQGYRQVADQMAQAKEAEDKAAKEAADKAAADKAAAEKAEQSERGDFKPKGKSKLPLAEKDQEWNDAYEDYFNS